MQDHGSREASKRDVVVLFLSRGSMIIVEYMLQAGRERLAPHVRSQVAVLPKTLSDSSRRGSKKDVEVVFLSKGSMKDEHRKSILDAAMKTKDMDNEHFLATVRSRLDRSALWSARHAA